MITESDLFFLYCITCICQLNYHLYNSKPYLTACYLLATAEYNTACSPRDSG